MPSDIDSCVESVLEDNPSYSDSRAYAICWAQKNEGNLSAESPEALAEFATRNSLEPECANKVLDGRELDEDDPCWEGYTMVGMKTENGEEVPNCVPDDEVPDADLAADCPDGEMMINGECVPVEDVGSVPPSTLSAPVQFTLRQLETGPIEREELSANEVLYRNVKVLESGTWTDSGSGETIWYSPRGLENLDVTDDNTVNIMHDSDNEVSAVGELANARADDGELYADIQIDTSNAAGEYADENMQQTLESNGAKGFGGPSVEIDAEGQEIEYNAERGLKELVKGKVSGLGLVANPASKPTAFARQTANRGVALSEGQTTYTLEGETISMANAEEIRETLDSAGLGDTIDDMTDEEVMDFAENLHSDLMGDLEGDGGMDGDTEASDDIENGTHYGDKDDEEDEEDMDMADDDMMEELQAVKQRLEVLEDEMETLSAQGMTESDAEDLADAEDVSELSDAVESLEKELSDVAETTKELAEEPEEPKSLAADVEFGDEDSDYGGRLTTVSDPGPDY